MPKYELLAPVGNLPMLVAAVNAGADAVYFGLKEFSMRAGARNFSITDLSKIRKICNDSPRKVKMYLTLNVIVYNEELKKIESTIKKVKGKVDAIICWDMSVIHLCKKQGVPFHISTQASVSNKEAAAFYKKLGAERVVLARELNLKQIKEISKIVDVECFAHGAMCLAISGRCLMSQFTFGKSANRGECVQNCRRSYIIKDKKEGFEMEVESDKIFSAKDLCTLPFIDKLKDAGIISFKIEGRNRDPRYVSTVITEYRKALDKKLSKKEIEESMEKLRKVYNRGFSNGFYLGLPGAQDYAKIENSAATEKKQHAGKIIHYLPKLGVAIIKTYSTLKVGDKIIVIGDLTGMLESRIERLEINKEPVNQVEKGKEVAIKLSKVRKNDEVYLILKN